MELGTPGNSIWFLSVIFMLAFFVYGIKKRISIIEKFKFRIRINFFRYLLITVGIILIIFSLLTPRIFKRYVTVPKNNLNIYFLIDVSQSMKSEDVKPNRLERSKFVISKLIENLKGDRVGFVPFSSAAYIQMPLTDDYEVAKMFLEVIDTNMIAGGGTNIGEAIKTAVNSFNTKNYGNKVLIIFSDGEEHNETAIEEAKKASGVKIFTVGFGTEKGSLIPEFDENGTNIGYKKDDNGNYVISKVNIDLLKKIADIGNGRFYLSTIEGNEIDKLLQNILNLKRDKNNEEKTKEYTHLFQYFLGIGIIIMLLGYFKGKSNLT